LLKGNGRIIAAAEDEEYAYDDTFFRSALADFRAGRDFKRKIIGKWIYLPEVIEINPDLPISSMRVIDGKEVEVLNEARWYAVPNTRKKTYKYASHPVVAGEPLEHILFANKKQLSE
jgi:hypothetical protein